MKKPSGKYKAKTSKKDKHRLSMIRRLIELPLLLQQRECSHQFLIGLYDCNSVTIRRDIRALSDYWPIDRIQRGREVVYRIAPDAKPVLKKLNVKQKAGR